MGETPPAKKAKVDFEDDGILEKQPEEEKEPEEQESMSPAGHHHHHDEEEVPNGIDTDGVVHHSTTTTDVVHSTIGGSPEEEAAVAAVARTIPENYVTGIQPTTKHDEKWNEQFYKMQDFKMRMGHCSVPQKYPQDVKLGRWVHYQRVEFWMYHNRGQGKITPERIDCLERAGFEWDPQRAQWNRMYNRLVAYKEKYNHVQVPKGYKEDAELANWVRNQRLEYSNHLRGKKHRMTQERQKQLEDLGFTWSASASAQGMVANHAPPPPPPAATEPEPQPLDMQQQQHHHEGMEQHVEQQQEQEQHPPEEETYNVTAEDVAAVQEATAEEKVEEGAMVPQHAHV